MEFTLAAAERDHIPRAGAVLPAGVGLPSPPLLPGSRCHFILDQVSAAGTDNSVDLNGAWVGLHQ